MSGRRILDAILAGERDPVTLARLCHGGVKSCEDTIAKSLEGDYRPEHLFALRQSLAAFHYYRSEEHTSELQSLRHLVCRLLLEKKHKKRQQLRNAAKWTRRQHQREADADC